MSKTSVISIVPVKNEAWILKNFIECARSWADLIIIGDHNSSDESARIASSFDFVKVIPLSDPSFYAGIRRTILIDEARKVSGKRLIFAIDADEMISANWSHSPEWDLMLNAPAGTTFHLDWLGLLPGLEQSVLHLPGWGVAFIDDGTEYFGTRIHETRIPSTSGEAVKLHDIKLLHYIYVDPERMYSKHRWYKCIEIIENGTRPWAACVRYQDTMVKTYDQPIVQVKEEWLRGYSWLDEYRSSKENSEKCYWYDEEVLNYLDNYGVDKFRKLNIWGVDWNKKARLLGREGNYSDPRSSFEVWVHKLIEKYRENLKVGQAGSLSKNPIFRLSYYSGRVGLRVLGW